jgi:hypothetical protein
MEFEGARIVICATEHGPLLVKDLQELDPNAAREPEPAPKLLRPIVWCGRCS